MVEVFDPASTHCQIKVKLKFTLGLTVSRPVCLGIKHPFGTYDQIFIAVWRLQAFWCGALPLTRGRVCHLPQSRSAVVSLLSLCTIYILHVCIYCRYACLNVCVYNTYKTSVSPGSVQQIMPYYHCSSCPTCMSSAKTAQQTPFLCCCNHYNFSVCWDAHVITTQLLPRNGHCLQSYYL
jgi:hypothetical protein